MSESTTYRKKLIEVALPLEEINKESAREKSIRHGHPSTLHLWWARRPLAACRAVLFSSLVDDPSALPEIYPDETSQETERERLFVIIRELVKWENSTNEAVLHSARVEIARSVARNHGASLDKNLSPAVVADTLAKYAPPVLDPFCGGGSIPLEAQRLGLEAHGSDLNPVAVLITKALIEIPPRFAGLSPVNPADRRSGIDAAWKGATGLAADVRYYGQWMRDEAERRIGHLYPRVQLPPEQGGGEATVIAWLWARTVKCPNPACGAQMPLVRSFELSKKKGKQAWVEPIVDLEARTVRFEVRTGSRGGAADGGTKLGRGAQFRCLVCDGTADVKHIKAEGMEGRLGAQLMAIVAEGNRGRVYVSPDVAHESIIEDIDRVDGPEQELPYDPRNIWVVQYGYTRFEDLFTNRQLVALTTFSDLVGEARERARQDALAAGLADDDCDDCDSESTQKNAPSASRFADAVALYLGMAISRLADSCVTLATWQSVGDFVAHAFVRQAIPMVWDYADVNPFSSSTRNFFDGVEWVARCVDVLPAMRLATVSQVDASGGQFPVSRAAISTDPPYYDNIGYADLSDFFYVWLRRSLREAFPEQFTTVNTPKSTELVATPYRHGGNAEKAERFFETGLATAFQTMALTQTSGVPVTIYYAFKQTETSRSGSTGDAVVSSTGWETMLASLLAAGFSITGTWPMRSERQARMLGLGSNALASSIVLVCRPRPADAPITTRQAFVRELKQQLPPAVKNLQHGAIAPVDLAQASIGPGMAVFSRYARVMEANGDAMRVRTALQLINQVLDETLTEQEGEFDADTRWAITWFEEHGMQEAGYGEAETLSSAKNTSIRGLQEAGIVLAERGKVRLKGRHELQQPWDPSRDQRIPVWEVTLRLIHTLETEGEVGTAALAARLPGLAEQARDLAYRLYQTADRKGWTQEALAFNSLPTAWSGISQQRTGEAQPQQATMNLEGS